MQESPKPRTMTLHRGGGVRALGLWVSGLVPSKLKGVVGFRASGL